MVVVNPDDNLTVAMGRFEQMDIDEMPVVDTLNPRKLVGMLKKGDIIAAYNRALLKKHSL